MPSLPPGHCVLGCPQCRATPLPTPPPWGLPSWGLSTGPRALCLPIGQTGQGEGSQSLPPSPCAWIRRDTWARHGSGAQGLLTLARDWAWAQAPLHPTENGLENALLPSLPPSHPTLSSLTSAQRCAPWTTCPWRLLATSCGLSWGGRRACAPPLWAASSAGLTFPLHFPARPWLPWRGSSPWP